MRDAKEPTRPFERRVSTPFDSGRQTSASGVSESSSDSEFDRAYRPQHDPDAEWECQRTIHA